MIARPRARSATLPPLTEPTADTARPLSRSASRPTVGFRATALTKVFRATVAVWDVDLEGRSGDLLAVHGPNGSGKTTLLRIVAGLVTPTRGRVSWTAAGGRATRPRIAVLGHATHLFDDLTALENVVLAARLARGHERRAIDLLDLLGLAAIAHHRVASLSAGTRRRVGLARAVATDPDVVIVDEPFAGLDERAADRVGQLLTQLRDEGRLVVIASHDDARSRSIATGTVWLDGGRVRSRAATSANGFLT